MRGARAVAVIGVLFTVSACADNGLRQVRPTGDGPDEFLVHPVKPLQEPDNYSALPPPTPGGVNRTDTNPNADAIVALGGNPALISAEGIPSSDAALVAQSSRYGVPGNIRQTVAEEDASFRKRKQRFTNIRLFPVDRYNEAYSREALDASTELNRYRAAGAVTPSAPPE